MRSPLSLLLVIAACSPLTSIKPNEDEVTDDSDVAEDTDGTKPADTSAPLDTAPPVDTDDGGTTGGTTGTTGGTTGTTTGTTGTGGDTADTAGGGLALPAAELRFEYQLAIDDQGNLTNFTYNGRSFSSALFLQLSSTGGAVSCTLGYGLGPAAGSGTVSGPFSAWMSSLNGLGGMWVQSNTYTAFAWVNDATGGPCPLTGYDPLTIHEDFLLDAVTSAVSDMPITIAGAPTAYLTGQIALANQQGAGLDPALYVSSWARLTFDFLPPGSRVLSRNLEFFTEGYQMDANEFLRVDTNGDLVPVALDGMTGDLETSTMYIGTGLVWFTL